MDIKTISLWICIIVFVVPALFFGFQKVRQNEKVLANFKRWGYSKVFMILLGVAEIMASVGLFFSQTRQYAICVYGVILVGAIFTHLKAKENKELIAPVSVLVLLIVIYFLNA